MADNTPVKNASAATVSVATDELSDSSHSPKVTLLDGTGSPFPISPATQATLAIVARATAGEYEKVAASATEQALGATGAAGNYLKGIWVVPATTSPGAVTLSDGTGSPDPSFIVFTGGGSSVADLKPFFIDLGIISLNGAWKITTGSNVSCIAVGDFT